MNEQKKIDHIEPYEKLLSQKLVEECMVAANRCCASFLKDKNCNGPFIGHRGFREDRGKEITKFLTQFLPEMAEKEVTDIGNYRDIMKLLAADESDLPVRSMVNRLLTRAEISTEAQPHMGMALPCYSHCTSPLRKYTDFLSHRQIKKALHDAPVDELKQEQLSELSAHIQRSRNASQAAELWLKCEFLQDKVGEEYPARISHMSSSGFTVRLDDNGIEGLVDLRKDSEKFSFDRWTATLSSATRSFQLETSIRVKLVKADSAKREILFEPIQAEASTPPEPPPT